MYQIAAHQIQCCKYVPQPPFALSPAVDLQIATRQVHQNNLVHQEKEQGNQSTEHLRSHVLDFTGCFDPNVHTTLESTN